MQRFVLKYVFENNIIFMHIVSILTLHSLIPIEILHSINDR